MFASFDSQAVTTVTLQSPCTVSSRRERSHSIAAHGVHALPLSNPTRNPRPTRTKSTTSGSPEFCASGIPRTQTLRKGFAHSDPRQRHGLKTRPRTQHMSCLPPGTELRSMSSLVSGGRRGFYMPGPCPHTSRSEHRTPGMGSYTKPQLNLTPVLFSSPCITIFSVVAGASCSWSRVRFLPVPSAK